MYDDFMFNSCLIPVYDIFKPLSTLEQLPDDSKDVFHTSLLMRYSIYNGYFEERSYQPHTDVRKYAIKR